MQIPDIIKNRRSIRAFSDKELPEGTAEMLVEAACWAPSAGNLQPWEFIVVRDNNAKNKLVKAAHGQSFIAEAPIVFVVCAVSSRSSPRYGRRGVELYCLQDTAAAVENLLLTAVHNSLGGCWIGAFDEDEASKAVGLPQGVRPIAIIPIGHPVESPRPRPRRNLSEVIHREKY